MSQDGSARAYGADEFGFPAEDPEAGRMEALRRMAQTFRPNELVWMLNEAYDPSGPAWRIAILRQGANGRWTRQRYRYDTAAEVLYFIGESPLSDAEFRAARAGASRFPVNAMRESAA